MYASLGENNGPFSWDGKQGLLVTALIPVLKARTTDLPFKWTFKWGGVTLTLHVYLSQCMYVNV